MRGRRDDGSRGTNGHTNSRLRLHEVPPDLHCYGVAGSNQPSDEEPLHLACRIFKMRARGFVRLQASNGKLLRP